MTPTTSKKSISIVSPSEITPLLRKASRSLSNTFLGDGRPRFQISGNQDDEEEESDDEVDGEGGREVDVYQPGKSTFMQTLLNCLGDIVGTGLLACPIAISHLGWILGPIMLVSIGLFSLWTLKLMLRIIEKDRRLRNFTDVIGYGLGPLGEKITTAIFVAEFAVWIIALVVLFSDTLEAVWSIHTSDEWKLFGLIAIIPTSFLPLRYLSFSSGLGIVSTYVLLGILVASGIANPTSPGSLRDPAPTDILPTHGFSKTLIAVGLLVSGFGGHGLVPNLIHDMRDPHKADRMCELAYVVAMAIYLLVAVCGYLMYGRGVSDEISKDLAKTPGVSPLLNKLAVWMVALNPLTKIPLGLRPVSDILFSYLHLHPTMLIPENMKTPYHTRPPSLSSATSEATETSTPEIDAVCASAERRHLRREKAKALLRPILRTILAVLATVGALVMPSFESVLAILGGGFGLVMIGVMPIAAACNILGWRWYHVLITALCGVMAVGVTVAGIITSRDTIG